MNIIKHGLSYYEITCPRCNCKFGCSISEMEKAYDPFLKNGVIHINNYYIHCPECNKYLNITPYVSR